MTSSEGIFEFHFKPGKVATETKSGAKWQIYAQAYDGTATASANQTGKNMNWFGEVTVNTASVDWGSVTPGTTWGDSTKQTGISVKYISNGAYDEQVAASAQWAGTSDNATLDAAGNCTNTNEFSLKADDTATLPGDGLVPATPSYLTIDNTGAQTSELGDTVATNTLWLKLSPVFLSKTTYNGTIYYQVVNHT
jgi:hypothetical protein